MIIVVYVYADLINIYALQRGLFEICTHNDGRRREQCNETTKV